MRLCRARMREHTSLEREALYWEDGALFCDRCSPRTVRFARWVLRRLFIFAGPPLRLGHFLRVCLLSKTSLPRPHENYVSISFSSILVSLKKALLVQHHLCSTVSSVRVVDCLVRLLEAYRRREFRDVFIKNILPVCVPTFVHLQNTGNKCRKKIILQPGTKGWKTKR